MREKSLGLGKLSDFFLDSYYNFLCINHKKKIEDK